jgi:copper homeostasis protein (lipoprotein)
MTNKSLKTFIFGIALLSFLACKNEQASGDTEPVADEFSAMGDEHTSKNSLDYAGTYKGITPCADCEGIEVELNIGMDSIYTLNTRYLGKEDSSIITTKGTYTWIDGNTIELSGIAPTDGPVKYKVGEGMLWQLDLEGNKVEGDLADKYILKKS